MLNIPFQRKVLLAELFAASVFLAACGGGGGADPTAAAPTADEPVVSAADPVVSGEAALVAPDPSEATLASAEVTATSNPAAETTDDAREAGEGLASVAVTATTDFAKPRVAALDYSSSTTLAKQQLLSRFQLVILGGRGGSNLNAFSTGIKTLNPTARIAYYVVFNELSCNPVSGSYYYPAYLEANKADWWLRKADGTRSQWTTAYSACDMNLSSWGKRNAAGQTWQQYKASFDFERVFKNAPAIEYVFSDNTMGTPRVDADWKRIGTNQLRTDPAIITAQREGQAAYWAALRALKPSLKIVGNANSDLSFPEYLNKLNGAMQEGAMGKSYSLETWAGWGKMMDRYRGQLRNSLAPKDVFLEVRGAVNDYKLMRYGLASALMEDGWLVYSPSSGTFQPTWYDDYDAPLGTAIEPPPTAAAQNGIWMRRYANGLVLVNPSKTTSASINVGAGYKRLTGTQDPTVNNGAVQSTVTLGPREGLLMIKQ